MPIAWLRVKWKKELVRACGADFRGGFVLLAALSLSFLLTGLSPSCYDSFLALVLNTDADKSWCSCEASGFLGDSFGHCTNSECVLCDFSLPAEPVPWLILKMCSDYFVIWWLETAHFSVSLSFLQFYFLCCCTTKRQKDWNRLVAHRTHMAYIYIGQVTEHSLNPEQQKWPLNSHLLDIILWSVWRK